MAQARMYTRVVLRHFILSTLCAGKKIAGEWIRFGLVAPLRLTFGQLPALWGKLLESLGKFKLQSLVLPEFFISPRNSIFNPGN